MTDEYVQDVSVFDYFSYIFPSVKQDYFTYICFIYSYRVQHFILITTHGLQKKTGGVFDWSVIASK